MVNEDINKVCLYTKEHVQDLKDNYISIEAIVYANEINTRYATRLVKECLKIIKERGMKKITAEIMREVIRNNGNLKREDWE